MPPLTTTTILSLLLPLLATAQTPAATPTVSVFGPFGDSPVVGSIRSVSSGTTALYVQCPSGTDSNDCGLGPGINITIISSKTYIMSAEDPGSFTMSGSCVPNTSASQGVCIQSNGGPGANFPGVETVTLTETDYSSAWIAVPVTEGADLLTSETGKPTASGASAKPTLTSGGPSNTATPEANASGTGAAPQESGAAVRIGAGGLFAGLGAVGAVAAFF